MNKNQKVMLWLEDNYCMICPNGGTFQNAAKCMQGGECTREMFSKTIDGDVCLCSNEDIKPGDKFAANPVYILTCERVEGGMIFPTEDGHRSYHVVNCVRVIDVF